MKTSITIADDVFDRLKGQASQQGISVSALVAQSIEGLAAANVKLAQVESELLLQRNGAAAAKPANGKRSSKPDETEITLSFPDAFLAQMIPGDKVIMMEDEILRRFGYGLFHKRR